jgi:hypothetical protein
MYRALRLESSGQKCWVNDCVLNKKVALGPTVGMNSGRKHGQFFFSAHGHKPLVHLIQQAVSHQCLVTTRISLKVIFKVPLEFS